MKRNNKSELKATVRQNVWGNWYGYPWQPQGQVFLVTRLTLTPNSGLPTLKNKPKAPGIMA